MKTVDWLLSKFSWGHAEDEVEEKTQTLPKLVDPLKLIKRFWPNVILYKEQRDIIMSLEENPETVVPAANQMGKDFISGLATLVFFIRRRQSRIVTTSVDFNQLQNVLWGEMRQFIVSAEYNGKRVKLPIIENHMNIRKVNGGEVDPKSYLIGRTATDQASLQGHHLARLEDGTATTLAFYDEASGISEEMFNATRPWRHRLGIIGNCYPCANYFYQSAKEGNLYDKDNGELIRKVIHIKAEQSPNIKYAKRVGKDDAFLLPGVITLKDYKLRRQTWNPMAQTIGLDAEFYEGTEIKLYAPTIISNAAERAELNFDNTPYSLGIDPASGGDSTSWAISSPSKLLELESKKTTDTMSVGDYTIELIETRNISQKLVAIDSGGGGLQIAHYLRRKGYRIQIVNAGSAFKLKRRAGTAPVRIRDEAEDIQKTYRNTRAFFYHLLSLRMDPNSGWPIYDIPDKLLRYSIPGSVSLREQMEPIPLTYDDKGILYILSKSRKTRVPGQSEDRQITLTQLIGHSPDELEAVIHSVYAQYNQKKTIN